MRLVCFRFDVDTHVGVHRGVPRLVELGRELGAPFTFFFNMGRAAWRMGQFHRKPGLKKVDVPRIGNLERLGWRGYLRTALLNPRVGESAPHHIRAAREAGHEIGLHGGRNHGMWMRKAGEWSRDRLAAEVDWGLNALHEAGIESVTSFSSPGWQGSDALNEVLVERGFRVVADERETFREDLRYLHDGRLCSVPTNLLSTPGDTSYLEGKYARGDTARQIVDQFRADLQRIETFAVVYGHPNFCGIAGLSITRGMVEAALDEGFQPTTIGDLPARFGLGAHEVSRIDPQLA